MIAHSIAGRRILVTRSAEDSERWARRLTGLGAQPVVLPCLVCEAIDDAETAAALRLALADATWIVFSSRRGVESVARLLDGALPRHVRVAVVGPVTARAAAALFGRLELVADNATSAGLGRALQRQLSMATVAVPPHVVVAGASAGRKDLEAALGDEALVTRVDVYRTVPAPPSTEKRDLAADNIDDILLASPSAAVGLVNRAVLSRSARVITIGPTTTAAARDLGLTVAAEAQRPNLESMLEAMP